MRNFKISLDLSNIFREIRPYKLRDFDAPFLIIFTQAQDPDEVCHEITMRIIYQLLKIDNSIETMVLCRKVKKQIRFDRIQFL